jgi:hypothetical protein
VFSIVVYPLIAEIFTGSSRVVFDDVEDGKDESKGKKKDHKNRGEEDDDILRCRVASELYKYVS